MAESKLHDGESVIGTVYRYLKDNKDIYVHVADIRKDNPHLNPTSIDSAINRIVRIPSYKVTRGEIKGTYIYNSGPQRKTEVTQPTPIAPTMAVKEVDTSSANVAIRESNSQFTKGIARMYERVGRLNDMCDIIRDDQDRMHVAIPLDTYIHGKPTAH